MAESTIVSKHEPTVSCPITKEDIKQLEADCECYDEAKGWYMLKKTEFAEIWQKSDGSPIPPIKGNLFIPNVPLTEVLELIMNFDLRLRWDTRHTVLEEIEVNDDYKVIYAVVRTPPGSSDRDFVGNYSYGVNENGVHYIIGKNTTHPKKPEVPGLVRGETILSGMLLYADKDDPNSTRATLLLQDDIKGYIPQFISNIFYTKAPIQWRDSLYNFYHDVYKHEKNNQ